MNERRSAGPRSPVVATLLVFALAIVAPLTAPSSGVARAEDADAEAAALPLVYEGDGLRVVIDHVSDDGSRFSGTLHLGEAQHGFTARVRETEAGEVIRGQVTTPDGRYPLHVVEESDDVALVTFDGTTYRVKRVVAPPRTPVKAPPPSERPERQDAPRTAPAAVRPTGRVVLRRHTLKDPGSGNMDSHTLLAPSDWTVEGGAWWPAPAYYRILPSQDIKVAAPDGRLVRVAMSLGATDFIPSDYAARQLGSKRPEEGTASEGNLVLHLPGSLDAWKTFIAEKGIRGNFEGATDVKVAEIVVIPELTELMQRQLEPFQRENAATNERSRAMGSGTFSFCDGSVLGATTTFTWKGKRWEQLNVFGVTHFGLDTQVGRQLWWSIEPNIAYLAPEGQLEASLPLMMAITSSVAPTPAWAKMKADHAAKMNQIAAKGAADRARIWADANREINKIINDGWKERQAIQDDTHRKVINCIRGVEDYVTGEAGGTSVQLPNVYDHVYTNGNGEYVLTNDVNYDPNADAARNNQQWERMKRFERK